MSFPELKTTIETRGGQVHLCRLRAPGDARMGRASYRRYHLYVDVDGQKVEVDGRTLSDTVDAATCALGIAAVRY